jgi:hypothetical protein
MSVFKLNIESPPSKFTLMNEELDEDVISAEGVMACNIVSMALPPAVLEFPTMIGTDIYNLFPAPSPPSPL